MDHGVGASLLAALATAVMRNVRRSGGRPDEQVTATDQQLLEQFGGVQFVTALAMRLDLTDGQLQIVNAGHPRPWLVRDGRAEPLELDAQLPAGMLERTAYRTQTVQLIAADRLVLVTDGVLEAGAPGPEFGEDRAVRAAARHRTAHPPPVRRRSPAHRPVLRPTHARRRHRRLPGLARPMRLELPHRARHGAGGEGRTPNIYAATDAVAAQFDEDPVRHQLRDRYAKDAHTGARLSSRTSIRRAAGQPRCVGDLVPLDPSGLDSRSGASCGT